MHVVTMGPVTLINGDCTSPAVQRMVPDCDLLLDDPPYMGLAGNIRNYRSRASTGAMEYGTDTVGDPWGASLDWLPSWASKARMGVVIFSSTSMLGALLSQQIGTLQGVGVWYKRNSMPPLRPVPWPCCEFFAGWRRGAGLNWRAWPSHLDIPRLAAGFAATERLLQPGTRRALHPAQKPIAVMDAILNICPPGATVIDAHAGTGTVAAACIRKGVRCWSIERDPVYFAAAVERCRGELK